MATNLHVILWPYQKERVYLNKPEILMQLKETINGEIRRVESEAFEGVMVQVLKRALGELSRKWLPFMRCSGVQMRCSGVENLKI